jgi:hypothetical protein
MIQESIKFHTADNKTVELRLRDGKFSATLWNGSSGRGSDSLTEFFDLLASKYPSLHFTAISCSRTTETDFKMFFEKSNKS